MKEFIVMMLCITAVLLILYPIRPWRKKYKEMFYNQEIAFPSNCDKDCQDTYRGSVENLNQLEADAKYDTVDPKSVE